MVEHTAHNGKVVGSNPTKLKYFYNFCVDYVKRIKNKKITKNNKK